MMLSGPFRGVALLAVCACPLVACRQLPPARPLDPDALLASVRTQRDTAPTPEGHALTLAEATSHLRRANPAIRRARTDWIVADAVARTRTPLPNPTVSLGPLLFGGGNILNMATVGYQAAIGWAIPIANPPRLADDVNRVRAGAAFARAAAVERQAYLTLRGAFADAILGEEGRALRERTIATASAAETHVRRMAQAGAVGPMDLRLIELETARQRTGQIVDDGRAAQARHRVARSLGLDERRLIVDPASLPMLPAEIPAIADIERAAIAGHPELDILRASYLVAEKVLRQAAARGNPGLDIGAAFERTQPTNQLGLPLGIELPIFDRNQVAVAGAKAERDGICIRYQATLHTILSDIAAARTQLETQMALIAALDTDVKQATDRTVASARRAIEAGTIDGLRYLDAVRSELDVARDQLAARRQAYEAWAELEKAAGVPLLAWPEVSVAAPAAAKEGE